MNKNRLLKNAAPRRLIVDDRNINWNNRKSIDPVAEQQSYEFSQIPFPKKVEYAARYFREHCHDCYCRDGLVSPTSKYLCQEENPSDSEQGLTCTCPLNHPCTLNCLPARKNREQHDDSLAPFLRNKKKVHTSLRRSSQSPTCSDYSSNCRLIRPVSNCSDKAKSISQRSITKPASCSCAEKIPICKPQPDLEPRKLYLKNRQRLRKVIKSQEGIEDNEKYVRCSGDSNCPKKNLTFQEVDGLNYTKQREKYEQHKTPLVCTRHKYMNGRNETHEKTDINDLDMLDVCEFRNEYYFDTHDPFSNNLHHFSANKRPCTASTCTNRSKNQQSSRKSKEIPCSNEVPQDSDQPFHRCVYSFQLNNRLQAVPLNPDTFGRNCCDVCSKPMTNVRKEDVGDGSTKSKEGANKLSSDNVRKQAVDSCKTGTTCSMGCRANSSILQAGDVCTKKCTLLESQKIHIGCGNERIKLTIPNGLLGESIGHSVEVTNFASPSKGSKSKESKGAVTQEQISWNSNRGKVNPAERPNSYALRHQKFSMHNKK